MPTPAEWARDAKGPYQINHKYEQWLIVVTNKVPEGTLLPCYNVQVASPRRPEC
jgi:hypothetical protein